MRIKTIFPHNEGIPDFVKLTHVLPDDSYLASVLLIVGTKAKSLKTSCSNKAREK